MSMCALCAPILAALLSLAPVPAASASNGMEWALERWEGDGPARLDIGAPESTRAPPQLPRIPASRPWTLCAVYPHLKDSYWLAVNYGMVDEARALGLGLRVLMGKGYENLESQRAGVSDCIADTRTDALLVGTVSFAGLNDLLRPYAAQHPVLGLVNDIDASVVRSRVGVPWYQLGWQIGR
ncbi:MAG TPA: TMAO reductase system periplasmic protein TorT, partial [Thauera sp.]|nr:TMAO reductase system periplasmic protein TorT [Thauera sp.]